MQRVVRDMQEAGIPPSEATHGSLVSALVRCGEIERAWFALRVRCAAARTVRKGACRADYCATEQSPAVPPLRLSHV